MHLEGHNTPVPRAKAIAFYHESAVASFRIEGVDRWAKLQAIRRLWAVCSFDSENLLVRGRALCRAEERPVWK